MALGRRGKVNRPLFIASDELPRSAGHPFYRALNRLLEEAGFDRKVEEMCAPYYARVQGRPSIAPGVYFRMVLVGYFEGIDSQRGIAWRCSDSLALREFLGVGITGKSPDHSSLTVIRQRLTSEVHESVFALVLGIARDKKLLDGKTLGVDATLLEANAAMKSIVRRDTGEDWKAYLRRLAAAEGIENPSDEDLRRFDKRRGGKKASNDEWVSRTDPASRIMKMKDGRTHLSYKAEHAVDLKSELIVAATIREGNRSDTASLPETLAEAQVMLAAIGHEETVKEVVADKGYHSGEALATCAAAELRTYVPTPRRSKRRRWTDKPLAVKKAVLSNDRRGTSALAKRLQRQRSEKVERSFAHVCETGGARRTWLRGLADVTKRYLITVAAHNLGRILFRLFGVGTPRSLQGGLEGLRALLAAASGLLRQILHALAGHLELRGFAFRFGAQDQVSRHAA